MKRFSEPQKRQSGKGHAKKAALLLAAAICFGVLVGSLVQIVGIQAEQNAARQEYDDLREKFAPASEANKQPDLPESEEWRDPAAVNSDYVGWLQVEGTQVDYPVVRAADNQTYLNTTFEKARNPAGAIFMDCANTAGFPEGALQNTTQHVIIYGHNMKNGTMFGGLYRYLDAGFRAQNDTVTVTTPQGTVLTYRIFAARIGDAWDASYQTSFTDEEAFSAFAESLGAPADAPGLLTMSTCTSSVDDNERMLVHAVLVA